MPKFRMGEHVRVRSRGLDFYGQVVAKGTSGKYWRYSIASFDELYYFHGLREKEIETIEGDPMPKVYNKHDNNVPEDAIYVGRPTEWGNPFVIGRDGTREEVVEKFEAYAHQVLKQKSNWLDLLKGKDLACWCVPEACHANILLRLANNPTRPFAIRSNQVGKFGFRVKLCEGEMNEDSTIRLTWTGNNIIDARTGEKTRVQLQENYDSMDALLSALGTQDVRCIYWQDTREYQHINKE